MSYRKEEARHEHSLEESGKQEAAAWMEIRAKGLFEDPSSPGTGKRALQDCLPNQARKKGQLALLDKDQTSQQEDPTDSQAEEANRTSGSKMAKKDEQTVEADLLSDVGGQKLQKQEASTRVNRMLRLTKQVQKDVGKEKGKMLTNMLAKLEKLNKQGSQVSLEAAKGALFDAALAIKKVKYM